MCILGTFVVGFALGGMNQSMKMNSFDGSMNLIETNNTQRHLCEFTNKEQVL
jgi:hypothetical protein